MDKYHRLIIILFILFIFFSLYQSIPKVDGYFNGFDERSYYNFASRIAKNGISEYPLLIKHYCSDAQERFFPTPSRAGYVLLAAGLFKVFGASLLTLAHLSFFSYVLFILTCFYFARKFFGKDIAYNFTLLLSSSPLLMGMARRALTDSMGNLFLGLTVWLFLDFLVNNKKTKFLLFLCVFTVSISVRESSLTLLAFFILIFFMHKYYFKKQASNIYLICMIFIPILTVGILYIMLFGGVKNFLDLIGALINLHTLDVKLSQYAVGFCTGPWYKYIIDYLLLSPIVTLLFIGYFGKFLVDRRWDWGKVYFLLYFSLVFLMFSNLKYAKMVRFIMSLDMVVYLCAVLMLYELFRQDARASHNIQWVFLSVTIIFLLNFFTFLDFIWQLDIYDLLTYKLLVAAEIIPFVM